MIFGKTALNPKEIKTIFCWKFLISHINLVMVDDFYMTRVFHILDLVNCVENNRSK